MKLIRQISLMLALGLCAQHAFADGDSATISFKGSIRVPPCTVNQVQPVNLGTDIPMSTFNQKGAMSTPVAFDVSMTCPAGYTTVSYQLDPAGGSRVVDEKGGVMSLSNTDGASGVGVKVMDAASNAAIPLSEKNAISQYDPNKFDQPIDLKFVAAYIQTDANVKGGEADAQATFTLSYE
ncbi:fimbrial protein [Burkholderia latens]|uniref:fimbrial protein n=1 Tax=Burkholderia latens TaxID=488446 RepID=UPI00158A3CD7|nr:fimbrial protein [Burkholderia latens]